MNVLLRKSKGMHRSNRNACAHVYLYTHTHTCMHTYMYIELCTTWTVAVTLVFAMSYVGSKVATSQSPE